MHRLFVVLENGMQMHYRRAGDGPPVLLLHPSPQSSAFSVPMAQRLAKNFTAICVDTPGYGLSDRLPGEPSKPELQDYVAPLRMFLDALGIERAALYGNATGAEIAQLFAHSHPERVAFCMLDTAGHKEDADLDAMLAGYFPDVTPRRDGGHLLTHWDMVRSLALFSPWHHDLAANRLRVDLPSPEALHRAMLDYLRAGKDYAAAYRPAFYTAKHRLISRVRVPATLMRWAGKPDLSEVDALIERGLPSNFTVLHAGPSVEERQAVNERYLIEHWLPSGVRTPPPPPQTVHDAPRLQSTMIEWAGGAVHALEHRGGAGPLLLGLHGASSSARTLSRQFTPLVAARPLLLPDLPGFGASETSAGLNHSPAAHAAIVAELLTQRGIESVDVVGEEFGAAVALELAVLRPGLVRNLWSWHVREIDTAYRDAWLREADVSIAPRWDGAHLVTAWGIVRDRQLFSPWFERRARNAIARDGALDPVKLDAAVFDLLQAGDAWRDASRQLLDYFFERSLETRVAALGIAHRALGDGPLGPALLQGHL
jgi:pimeloyl-ACP methyl ester carboxylesterase